MCYSANDSRNPNFGTPHRCSPSNPFCRVSGKHAKRLFGKNNVETRDLVDRHIIPGGALSKISGERAQLALITEDIEELQILSRDRSYRVRQALAANPTAKKIAPDAIAEMARTEMDERVLATLAGELGAPKIASAAHNHRRRTTGKGARYAGELTDREWDTIKSTVSRSSFDPANPVEDTRPRPVDPTFAHAAGAYARMMDELEDPQWWEEKDVNFALTVIDAVPGVIEHLRLPEAKVLISRLGDDTQLRMIERFGASSPQLLKRAYLSGGHAVKVAVLKEHADERTLAYMVLDPANRLLRHRAALGFYRLGLIKTDPGVKGQEEAGIQEAIAYTKTMGKPKK